MNDFAKKLTAPDGRQFTARSAAEYNDLRFGQGYRPAEETTAEAEPAPEPEPKTARRNEHNSRSATPKTKTAETPDA
jgi:hypothetical protein